MLASIQLNPQYTVAVNMVGGEVFCMALSVLCNWDRITKILHMCQRQFWEVFSMPSFLTL